MNLKLTWHDVIHMYECNSLASAGFYLKSRFDVVRMVSCLPKSNKGLKDDYLIVSGDWHDSFHCPTLCVFSFDNVANSSELLLFF